jgi:Rrf2 family protein
MNVYKLDRDSMKLSRRGLYALKALLHLAQAYERGGVVKIREVASAEELPEKFLEAILVLLKNARLVVSERGREGGYRLRRPPSEIVLGDVVRLVDGPLAPFGDVVELERRVRTERRHAGLFAVLLDVRNAAAAIMDRTTLADVLERDARLLQARASSRSETRRG